MRSLLSGVAAVVIAMSAQAQTLHESMIGFTNVEIGVFNHSLEKSGMKTSVRSLSVWSMVDTSGPITRFGRIRGEIEINCGSPTRKVDVARIKFVLPEAPELSGRLADSLESEGLAIASPETVMSMLSNRLDARDLFRQTLVLGLKACNTPAGKADHLLLAVWGERPDEPVKGLVTPMLAYQIISADRYAELTKF